MPFKTLLNTCYGTAFIVTAILSGSVSSVHAQQTNDGIGKTLFIHPKNIPDYNKYSRLESCLVAVNRVADSVEIATDWNNHTVYDTLPFNPDSKTSEIALNLARFCKDRFANSETASEIMSHFHLAVVLGEFGEAKNLLNKRLAQLPVTNVSVRQEMLFRAINIYINARPMAVGPAEELLAVLDTLDGSSLENLFRFNNQIATYARSLMDTAVLKRAVGAMHRILAKIPQDQKETPHGRSLVQATIDAEAPLLLSILRDSGSIVYTARLFSRYVVASGRSLEQASIAPIGTTPKPLEGKFWYNKKTEATVYPRSGRVSLVLMNVRHDCDLKSCANSYRTLERLSKRFSDKMDVILVGQTQGFFGLEKSPPPEKEANQVSEYFLKNLKVPAVMLVEETEFYKRKEPDGRRFNNATESQTNYSIFYPLDRYQIPPPPPTLYVVNGKGAVVYKILLTSTFEREITALIAILLERGE